MGLFVKISISKQKVQPKIKDLIKRASKKSPIFKKHTYPAFKGKQTRSQQVFRLFPSSTGQASIKSIETNA